MKQIKTKENGETNTKKQQILEAASEIFSKTGYFETSMKEVADKAGIAVGTIYLYYKNKEELLDGIYQSASNLLLDRINQKIAAVNNPMEKLNLFINESIQFGFNYPYYFLIVFVDFRRKAVEFPHSVTYQFFHEYLSIGGAILDQCKAAGELDFSPAQDVIFGITGFWGAYVLREILSPVRPKNAKKKKQEQIFAIFEDTILKGLKTAKKDSI